MFTELFLMIGSISIPKSLAWMSSDEIEFKASIPGTKAGDFSESVPLLETFFKHLILIARKITDLPAPWI